MLDLYANKLAICPSWNLNSNIKLLDLEQNLFSTETNIDINLYVSISIIPLYTPLNSIGT